MKIFNNKALITGLLIITGGCLLLSPIFIPFVKADYGVSENVQSQLGLEEDLGTVIVKVTRWILSFVALLATILIIYGGFTWMTAAGSEEKVSSAKKIIQAAIIGLVIVLLAWAIVSFVIEGILKASSNTNG